MSGGASHEQASVPATEEPPLKKRKKHDDLDGYTQDNVDEKIKLMKQSVEIGGLREFTEISIRHTIITKDWQYNNKDYCE